MRNWGDLGLGGEWAEMPIHAYGIKPWNGFEKVVFPMAKHVTDDKYGIAYSGIAYLDQGVKVLPLVANPGDAPQAPT